MDFFSSTVDEEFADSAASAFGNLNCNIADKHNPAWKKQKSKPSSKPCLSATNTASSTTSNRGTSRFIPVRDECKFDQQQSYQSNNPNSPQNKNNSSPSSQPENHNKTYHSSLKSSTLSSSNPSSSSNPDKVLTFQTKAPAPDESYLSNLRVLYTSSSSQSSSTASHKKNVRHISKTAERVLDAPDLLDDYYLNLLHWGSCNLVAVGLASSVYLWDAVSGDISLLIDYNPSSSSNTYVCSVRFNHNGQYVAVGTSDAVTTLYDVRTRKALRKLRGHESRVASLAWNHSILSSGSADSSIRNHDVRQKQPLLSVFGGHEQEVCGLQWDSNVSGKRLASGSNDNKCCVWSLESSAPLCEFTECLSAVKALAWCPWNRNLLATGGGSGDRKIRVYNVGSVGGGVGGGGTLCNVVDAQSQVTSLVWNPFEKELLSSHGFSKNQLSVWKYPGMNKTHDLTGHTARVLHTTLSPDGRMVCSAAADETLRFWNVFQTPEETRDAAGGARREGSVGTMHQKRKLNLRIR